MSQLICYSTGESIQKFAKQLRSLHSYPTLVYGDAFRFVLDNLKIEPDYWVFADPHAILESMALVLKRQKSLKTRLFVFIPMMDNLKEARRYHGTPGSHPKYDWKASGFIKFNRDLDRLSEFLTVERIETGSYKEQYWDNTTDIKNRMWALLQSNKFHILPVHGFSGDKLHSVVLPLVTTYLKCDNIYLVGFDGKGPRYNHGTGLGKQRNMTQMQDTFLPFWNDWLVKLNKNVYSLIPDKFCRTNKFFPYIPIESLATPSES